MKKERLLIIRFSSFGDIVQAWGVARAFKLVHPHAEVHWVTRSDFAEIVRILPDIDCVWQLERRDGIAGLNRLGGMLNAIGFSHVYDAHSNLRSHLLNLRLKKDYFIRRSKERSKRFLLFQLGKNLFPEPFRAQLSYLRPLRHWGIRAEAQPLHLKIPDAVRAGALLKLQGVSDYVVLAPSAAWELKRWPVEHWKTLIAQMPDTHFIILGGKEDTFCQDLLPRFSSSQRPSSRRVLNLAGTTSLLESIAIIEGARGLVSADTGTLHVGDALGIPTLALIGPTAFGYPSLKSSRVLEVPLACRPCSKDGRGRCHNMQFKKCMSDITPEYVKSSLEKILSNQDVDL